MAYHGQCCTHPQLSDSSLVGQLTQQARHCQQSSAPHSHLQPANCSLYYYYLLLLLTTTTTTTYCYCKQQHQMQNHSVLEIKLHAPHADSHYAHQQGHARCGRLRMPKDMCTRRKTVYGQTICKKQHATAVGSREVRQGVPGHQQWLLPRHGCPAQQAIRHQPPQRPGPSSSAGLPAAAGLPCALLPCHPCSAAVPCEPAPSHPAINQSSILNLAGSCHLDIV